MAGIIVLSDSLKGGNKLGKTSAQKEKNGADSSKNAADIFAAILGSSNLGLNVNVTASSNPNLKGQNSSGAGQVIAETQSAGDSLQLLQKSSTQGNVLLGYGNSALPFMTQFLLQKDIPAGKEANSGSVVSQGTGNSPTALPALINAAMLNLISLASAESSAPKGIAMPNSQGGIPGTAMELDKYRKVISDLLVALSGEITASSSMGDQSGSAGAGTAGLRQEMVKMIQGWMVSADDVAGNSAVSTDQKGIQSLLGALITEQSVNPGMNEKNQKFKDAEVLQGVKEILLNESESGGKDSGPAVTSGKDTTIHSNSEQNSAVISFPESKESSAVKDRQNQNFNPSIGVVSNSGAVNVSDGKTTAAPVWEQISSVVREQVINRSQNLKQLDIQLQPADLGKIQINLHWENGQVHLQLQASQAETGQLLQNHFSDLRQALSNQGVNCGMLQLGQGGAGQQNSRGENSRSTLKQPPQLDEEEDLRPGITSFSMEQDGINRINVEA